MSDRNERVRVLFSFPLRLGADRICGIAWQQVNGLAAAGADVSGLSGFHFAASSASDVRVSPTLATGKFRLPYSIVGTHARRCFARSDCGPPNREVGWAD